MTDPWDAYAAQWPEPERSRAARQRQAQREAVKAEAFRKVCQGGLPACAWCGETDLAVLTLDHQASDGAAGRRRYPSGQPTYHAVLAGLIDPFSLAVLCWNCNHRKSRIDTRQGVTRWRGKQNSLDTTASDMLYSPSVTQAGCAGAGRGLADE